MKQEAESPEEEEENSNMDDINTLSLVGLDDMQVVDEQPDIITLSAATNKSEDEQNFMLSCLAKAKPARKRKQTFYKKTCEQCKDTFHTRRIYEQHIQFGLCNLLQTKLCCSVCPLTFSLQVQLDTHLAMHRLNRFFCTKNCGKFFITLEECKLHEYRQHKVRRIMCTVCQHKFTSVKAWSQHLSVHNGLERFVCSFCYVSFESSMELAKHWKLYANTCGRLMQSYSDTIESIGSTSAERLESLSKGTRGGIREDSTSVSNTLAAKRAKVDMEDCQKQGAGIDYLSLNDVELKEEPLTDHEIPDDLESVLTNPTSTNESEASSVFIKSEPCDTESDNVKIKEEPQFDDDNDDVVSTPVHTVNHPGFRVIPVSSILAAKQPSSGQPQQQIPNLRLVRLTDAPSIQQPGVPAIGQTVSLKPLQIQNQNIQIPPIKAFKIFKIIPNTKMIRLPSGAIASRTKITTNMSNTSASKPIFLRLKPAQSVQSAAVVNVNAPTGTTIATTQSYLGNSPKTAVMPLKTVKTEQKPIVVHLSSLGVSTSIDAEDLKRLVIEAEAAKNSAEVSNAPAPRRNTCKSKVELAMIERIPQKRALIENWKQQVKQFETPLNNNDNKADDGPENAEVKLETKLDSSQAEVKNESKPAENLGTKLATKQDIKLLTNKEILAALIDKSNNKLPNFVITKKDLIQNSNEKIVEPNLGDDDDEDDCESKSLVIDEDGNNSNSSFGSKEELVITTSTEKATNEPPPIFYLPVTTECDPELQATRKLYPHLRYQWRCPRCPRTYAQKHSFRGHLVSAHGMCQEEFVKLIVEVKPSQSAKSLEELKISPKKPLRANSESETESNSTMDSNSNITDTTTTANKPPRTNRTNTKLTCAKCGRVCSTRTALNDHILANCSREPQYPCTVCPKRFFSSSTLNQHMSIHTGALPYKCNYCDKRFRTRGQVTVHHRTHTGERPFECQVCGQCFTHRETLISHLSRHIGMKRYKCYGCNQQFACISGLKTHREVRFSSCGQVKLNTRAIGPRVRVIKGNVIFEAQPEINPYLRTEDPQEVLAEVQNKVKN